ncbi:hypothetical protein Val02_04390 [Virgisporangium aliadipatigenens]|uniref:MarR family transcriptional regulator n=1 Tax=Virgisporangium aliadipatigenens TaxID=741659 RepID=A0A8J3YGG3_9ACTN|nr:MarR family winged helix-turn-helix transcriptional regulator [Virgisporangium aliadipatigenens]GIJ43553.1 hypothetical protein Val02_04390 [Virgisporangium aliadipatigenens]
MDLAHLTDAELAAQPTTYWTGVAHEALSAFTRARQAEFGFSQPQFWLLRHLSTNDLSPDGRGMTIPELAHAMRTYLRPEDDLGAEADVLLGRGWLTRDGESRWSITDAGERARIGMKERAPAIRALIHAGIDDADYAAALRVLDRLIRNVTDPAGR